MRFGQIRTQRESPLEKNQGLLVLTLLREDVSQVMEGNHRVGIEGHGTLEGGNRLGDLARVSQDATQVGLHVNVKRIGLGCLLA